MNPEVVELFAGPGGMGLGAEMRGFTTVGVEWCPNAVATRRAAGFNTVHGDVRNYGPADFPSARILAAGPPCQTFSMTGNGSGRSDLELIKQAIERMADRQSVDLSVFSDERTGLVLEPLRWILTALDAGTPYEGVILEQVPQTLPVWESYAAVLRDHGYSVATGVLNTEQYGVPQTRRRAVLVAVREGEAELPRPTHRKYRKGVEATSGDPSLKPWISMGEALDRTDRFVVFSNYSTGGTKNRGQRTSLEPASTVTRPFLSSRLYGADGVELDRFTFADAGVFQGFPADWPWSPMGTRQQIGNACPPPLAYALFSVLS